MPKPITHLITGVLIGVILLFVGSTQAAVAPGGEEAIKAAIQAAVLDGLNTIDKDLRKTYWYYLQGANMSIYNVSIISDRLNYIIVYTNKGNIYKVDCDLKKETWMPKLNSFVKLVSGAPANKPEQNSQSSNSTIIDLTDQASFNKIIESASKEKNNTLITPQIIELPKIPPPPLKNNGSN